MKLKCRNYKAGYDVFDNVTKIYIETGSRQDALSLMDKLSGKDISVEIKAWSNKRSINANAYFHSLVGKIAEVMRLGNGEVKVRMVLEYGTVMTHDGGGTVGFKLPKSVDVKTIYPYAEWFDERVEDGVEFNCYKLYKRTHTLDTAEMARLIDGVVYEAKELGIETETPEQIAKMMSLYKQSEDSENE